MFVYENTGDGRGAGEQLRPGRRRAAARAAGRAVVDRPAAGASTPTCAPRAATARWPARWRPTRYYARWSSPWEAQALLRARPVAGDAELGARFVEMIDPVRYPDGGVAPDDLIEIRRLKGRIDSERLPRGADPTTHTKLGRGGLADIEWTVQLLQLEHGARRARAAYHPNPGRARRRDRGRPDRRGPGRALAAAWRLATHVRNAIMLVRDKAERPAAPPGHRTRRGRAGAGLPARLRPGPARRRLPAAARRARRVVEEVFYG